MERSTDRHSEKERTREEKIRIKVIFSLLWGSMCVLRVRFFTDSFKRSTSTNYIDVYVIIPLSLSLSFIIHYCLSTLIVVHFLCTIYINLNSINA